MLVTPQETQLETTMLRHFHTSSHVLEKPSSQLVIWTLQNSAQKFVDSVMQSIKQVLLPISFSSMPLSRERHTKFVETLLATHTGSPIILYRWSIYSTEQLPVQVKLFLPSFLYLPTCTWKGVDMGMLVAKCGWLMCWTKGRGIGLGLFVFDE